MYLVHGEALAAVLLAVRVVACEDKDRNAPALEPNPYVAHVAFFAEVSEADESVVGAHL